MASRRGPSGMSSGQMSSAQMPRMNEYFLPRDGIDREVIQADICRYLGNDALVRPGTYENPQTGQTSQGYYITAYRNLTSAMIDDLKNDSARWEQERRMQQSRNSSGVQYRTSDTYARRQMTGPSSNSQYDDRDPYAPRYPGSDAPGYSANPSATNPYGQAAPSQYASAGSQYSSAASGASYGSGGYPAQSQYQQDPRYAGQTMQMTGYQTQPENPYVDVGANRVPMTQPQTYNRDQYPASSRDAMTTGVSQATSYATAGQTQGGYGQAGTYYGQQPAVNPYAQPMQPQQHPHDPFMGRMAADRTTSPGASKGTSTYPSAAAGHTPSSYGTAPAQYDDQPQVRGQGQSSSSSRTKESKNHQSDRYHKHR